MTSRRGFIKKTAAAIGAVTIVPSYVLFAKSAVVDSAGNVVKPAVIPPSDKINMAFCGIGNRGGQDVEGFNKTGLINTTVLCDVDMGGPQTIENMKAYPNAKKYQDFREMFNKSGKEFDAVCIGTPDFSHFPITILAMSLGKHVYTEKPLSRTFNESQLLIDAAKKYKVVTQMGNQGHSEANYHQFKAWTEAGIIKDVTKIVAHMNGRRRWHSFDTNMVKFPPAMPIPATLDWDTWLMTARAHDYNKDYIDGQWRCWFDFGMGALGDWGAHIIDTAHQFLDLGLPYEVDPIRIVGHNPLFFPLASTLAFKFPERGKMPPVDIMWYDGLDNVPQLPEGFGTSELDPNIPAPSKGELKPAKLNPGKEIYSKDLIFKGGSHGSTLSIIPKEKAKEMESKLPEVPKSPSSHYENFIRAIHGTEKTNSRFEVSGPLSQVLCLGVIAQKLNTKIKFDRSTRQITNNKFANDLLVGIPPREGWEEYYKL